MNTYHKFSALLIFISSSVYADSAPDWLEGEARNYPENQYMQASGSASKAELAKDRALANLSKIFETHIKESSTTKSDTQVNIKDGKESYTKQQHLAQQIQLRTDKIVNGARIAETWKDESVFTYHALAVLDRAQASSNIYDELLRIDDETKAEVERSNAQSDVLLSISALDKAVKLQRQRLALHNMLKVINIRGRGDPSQWNLAQLRGQLETRLYSIQMGAAVDNDPIGKLDKLLRSAMGNSGFPAVNGKQNYTLVANLEVQDLGFRQGWYWLRGKLSVQMVEADGKIRGRKQWPLKVSALQHNDAESRLMSQAAKKLNAELKPAILEFVTGVE